MKKRFLLILLTLLLAMVIGCENVEQPTETTDQTIDDKEKLDDMEEFEDEIGIKPYVLSDENKNLLRILSLEREANIFSFKAPKTVKNIKANIYILDEDNDWKEIDRLNTEVKDKDFYNNDILEGTFSIIIEDVHTKQMVVKLGSSIRTIRRDKGDSLIDREIFEGGYVSSSKFLENFKSIELNKEIPLAIMVENKGEEIMSYNINNFIDITNLEEFDYVQVVTLIFED